MQYTEPVQRTETIDNVTVNTITGLHFEVKVEGKRKKTFKGEFAWANAQRYANDGLGDPPYGRIFCL